MITRKIKLKMWLLAGYLLGTAITVYPAYLLYQVLTPIDEQNALSPVSKTRLSEFTQQLDLVSLQIHRLQAELISGRKLYRQKSFKDKNTTYLGQVFTNHDELLAILRDKWSRLQIRKASHHILQTQLIKSKSETSKSKVHDSHVSNDVSLMQYLQQSGPDIYVYWPTRDAYFIVTIATSAKPTEENVTEFLQQTPLQQFIMALPVNSQQRIIDKLQQQTNLTRKLQQISQHFYFLDQWQTDDSHTAWLLRVNLEGSQGLSAALLPIELAQLRNDSLSLSAHPTEENLIKTEYSAVIFDLRTVSSKPGLFPRIVTSRGDSVYTISQTDPNRITRNGAVVYSESLTTLQSMLGLSLLLVAVQEIRGPYGLDWVISEADASKIITANHRSGMFFKGRIGALLAN